jgi:ATP-dependent Clp protease, protease subunit
MEFETNHNGIAVPESRYIVPQFEERTSYGTRSLDPYTKLFGDRIVFLGVQVDDTSADDVMAQLLVLESQDPERDIIMYINSPGGSFTAMTAIYDTMQYVRPQIQTVVLGQAASAAAVIARGWGAGQASRAAQRTHSHPPAVDRRRWSRSGVRHRDSGERDWPSARVARGNAVEALE